MALRVLADCLARIPDVTVGVINHPQSNIADLYRELRLMASVHFDSRPLLCVVLAGDARCG